MSVLSATNLYDDLSASLFFDYALRCRIKPLRCTVGQQIGLIEYHCRLFQTDDRLVPRCMASTQRRSALDALLEFRSIVVGWQIGKRLFRFHLPSLPPRFILLYVPFAVTEQDRLGSLPRERDAWPDVACIGLNRPSHAGCTVWSPSPV